MCCHSNSSHNNKSLFQVTTQTHPSESQQQQQLSPSLNYNSCGSNSGGDSGDSNNIRMGNNNNTSNSSPDSTTQGYNNIQQQQQSFLAYSAGGVPETLQRLSRTPPAQNHYEFDKNATAHCLPPPPLIKSEDIPYAKNEDICSSSSNIDNNNVLEDKAKVKPEVPDCDCFKNMKGTAVRESHYFD